MTVDVVLDTVPIQLPEERVTADQLLELAKLNPSRELYRASRAGLLPVDKNDQLIVKLGDVFISKEKKHDPFFVLNFSGVAALGALVLSIFSLLFTVTSNRETGERDAVKAAYDRFLEFGRHQAQFPETGHLFVLPDAYPRVSALVGVAVANKTKEERAQLLIKERGMAQYILTHFESTLYDKKAADRFWDTTRANFQNEVLDYFTGRLLRNPRLLWYWDPKGGNLTAEFEKETIEYYNNSVIRNPNSPLTQTPDSKGPLALD